jgi:hypothetical protein
LDVASFGAMFGCGVKVTSWGADEMPVTEVVGRRPGRGVTWSIREANDDCSARGSSELGIVAGSGDNEMPGVGEGGTEPISVLCWGATAIE